MIYTEVRCLIWVGILGLLLAAIGAGACWSQDEPLIAEIRVEGNDYISPEAIVEEVANVLERVEHAQRQVLRQPGKRPSATS